MDGVFGSDNLAVNRETSSPEAQTQIFTAFTIKALRGLQRFSMLRDQLTDSFSLMIHGGASAIHAPERYEGSLRHVIEAGAHLLEQGALALDAVTHCVVLLEDDPHTNAGRGSVLNVDGIVVCDASIMDGRTLDAGAIAGVRGVKDPVLLARAVMEKSEHVFLIGEGAERFARAHGISFEDAEYFLTEARIAQLAKAKEKQAIFLDDLQTNERKLGTVGAVARDKSGNSTLPPRRQAAW